MKHLINFPISVRRLQHQAGIGLIEVLVSIVLLSSVLLGAIGLQLSAAKEQRSAQFVSRAALLASEIGERMRVNRAAVKDGKYITKTTQADVKSDIDRAMNKSLKSVCSVTNPCTSSDAISTYDIDTWWQNIRTQMPPDSVGMLLTTTTGGVNTLARDIVIVWTEPVINKDTNNKPILLKSGCPSTVTVSAGTRCYTQRVML
ncbi:MAG: type pilus modification protein PilV [Pseudomonadota bacterium]|jgi:type IV pilus modification protein PilV